MAEIDDAMDAAFGAPARAANPLASSEVDSAIDTAFGQRGSNLRTSIYTAQDVNPDAYAEQRKLAKQTGLAPDFIGEVMPEVKREAAADAIDYDDLIRNNPTLADWLTDPENAKVAHDDLASLGTIGRALQMRLDVDRSLVGGAVKSVGSTLSGAGRLIDTGASYLDRGYRGLFGDRAADALLYPNAPWWLNPTEILGRPGQQIEKAAKVIAPPEERQNLVTDVAGGVGQIGTQIAGMLLAGPAGGTGMLFSQGADIQGDMADEAGATREQRDSAVLLGASVTALTERFGLDRLLNRVPPQIKNKIMRQLADVAMAGGTEAAQEAVEGAMQNVIAAQLYDPNQEIFEGLERDATAAGGAGMVARILLNAVLPGRQAMTATDLEQRMTVAGDGVDTSKLNQRDRDALRGLLKDQVAGGQEQVFLQSSAWDEAFTAAGIDPEQAYLQFAGEMADYREARTLDGVLSIPTERFLVDVPAEVRKKLTPKLRATPEGMAGEEAGEAMKQVGEASRRAVEMLRDLQTEQADAARDTIYNDLLGQLLGVYERGVAERNAQIEAARFTTMAQRLGLDPVEYYRSSGLRIGRQVPEALRNKLNVDTELDPILDRMRGRDIPTQRQAFGPSLLEFVRARGIRDDRGELRGMDIDKNLRPFERLALREDGMEIDRVREAAVEEGYFGEAAAQGIETVDVNAMLDAISEELMGRPRYSSRNADQNAEELIATIEAIGEELGREGIDIQAVDNETIKRFLREGVAPVEPTAAGVPTLDAGQTLQQDLFEDGAQRQTDTEEFRNWFGDSKVVDAEGKPLVVYHGTTRDFSAFKKGKGLAQSDGFFFAGPESKRYVEFYVSQFRGGSPRTMPVYLSLQNPKVVQASWDEATFANPEFENEEIARAKRQGHDGMIFEDREAGERFFVAFRPEQIKSAVGNRGTFDPNSPSILEQRKQGPRGSISLNPAGVGGWKFRIDLTGADLSTFQHEMAHFWLEQMKAAQAMAGVNPQVQADYQRILGWFGQNADEIYRVMKAEARKGGPITPEVLAEVEKRGGADYIRQQAAAGELSLTGDPASAAVARGMHEYWARGAEAYLFEGKAPTPALRDLFAKFWGWMRQVYRDMRRLNVTLSDDVRRVMDRLVATDDELALAADQQGLAPIFQDREQFPGTDEEWQAYQQQAERAMERAQADTFREVLAPLKREADALYQRRKAQVREEVEAEVNAMPAYQAQYYLRTGRLLDGELPEGHQPVKLAKSVLESIYGAPYLKRLTGMYSKEGGVTPEVIAGRFGFKSGRDLVEALVNLQPRQDYIKALTDERMVEQYGDPAVDGSLPEKAMAALHNDARAALMLEEVRALTRRSSVPGAEPPAYKLIRQASEAAVRRKRVKDIQPNKYKVAEARAGKQAFEAAAAGNYDDALRFKQQQLWAHELYRASLAAREAADKVEEQLGDLGAKAARERLAKSGADYLRASEALQAAYGYRRFAPQGWSAREWTQRLTETGEEWAVSEGLLQRLESPTAANLREVSYGEVEEIRDAIKSLNTLARRERTAKSNEKEIEWDEALQSLKERLAETQGDRTRAITEASRGGLEEFTDTARGLADVMLNPQTIIERLDGGETGPWHDLLWNQAARARDARSELREEVLRPLVEMLDRMPADQRARMAERVPLESLGGRELARSDLITMALNMGTAQNLEKLMRGGRWIDGRHVEFSQDVIDEVKQKLSREDWQMVEFVWQTIGKLWQPSIDLLERLGLPPPDKIDGIEVDTPFGKVQGEYFPLAADRSQSGVGQKQQASDAAKDIMGGITRAMTSKSRLKERTGAIYPLELDLQRAINKHLDDAITDVTHREFVLQANRILNEGGIMNGMQNSMGRTAYQALKGMVQRSVNDRLYFDPAMQEPNRLMDAAVVNLTTMALGYRFALGWSNWATGLVQGLARVNPGRLASGMGRAYSDLKGARTMVEGLSPYMKRRSGDLDYQYSEALKRLRGKQSLRRKVIRAGMAYQRWADVLVSTPVWLARYEEAMADYRAEGGAGYLPTEEQRAEAVRLADKAVQQTQTDSSPIGMSSVESDPSWRLFKMFLGPMIIQQNRIRDAVGKKGAQRNANWPERAGVLLAAWVVPSLLFDLLMGRGPDDEDEPEDVAKWAMVKAALYPLMTAPLVRDIAAGIEAQLLDKPVFGRSNPLVESANAIIRGASDVGGYAVDAVTDEEADEAELVDGAGRVLGGFGFPYVAGKTAGQFVYDVGAGEYEPEGPQDLRYLFMRRPE